MGEYGLVWKDYPEEIHKIDLVEDVDRRITHNDGAPQNLLVEGENLHVLAKLKEDGLKVDVIYIDPPYNTGKDFIYSDVWKKDSCKHSRWLSFMEKRLKIAHDLLSDDGVIFISIDEHEFAQLKLLLDGIFGENNFVENFIWVKNSTKNLSKTTSTNHEYVMCYAKDICRVGEAGVFRVPKPGLKDVEVILKEATEDGLSFKETEKKLKLFYKENKHLKGVSSYTNVDRGPKGDSKKYRVYTLDDMSAPKATGQINTYDLVHPITGENVKLPSRGWAYKKETMFDHISSGNVEFYEMHDKVPRMKRYLDTVTTDVQKSVMVDNNDGKKMLSQLFGEAPFDNAKPVSLIKELIISFPKDATVLDFFAGSGTTGQAVMELNKEDGGNRRFILCTNNENNICEDVTYERLRRVITGDYANGEATPLPNNLSYYRAIRRGE